MGLWLPHLLPSPLQLTLANFHLPHLCFFPKKLSLAMEAPCSPTRWADQPPLKANRNMGGHSTVPSIQGAPTVKHVVTHTNSQSFPGGLKPASATHGGKWLENTPSRLTALPDLTSPLTCPYCRGIIFQISHLALRTLSQGLLLVEPKVRLPRDAGLASLDTFSLVSMVRALVLHTKGERDEPHAYFPFSPLLAN